MSQSKLTRFDTPKKIIASHRFVARHPNKHSEHTVELVNVGARTMYYLHDVGQFCGKKNITCTRSSKNRQEIVVDNPDVAGAGTLRDAVSARQRGIDIPRAWQPLVTPQDNPIARRQQLLEQSSRIQ